MDGFMHVKNDKEFKKYTKPITDKALDDEIGLGAGDRLDKLEKKITKLEAKWKQDHELLIEISSRILPHSCGGNSLE